MSSTIHGSIESWRTALQHNHNNIPDMIDTPLIIRNNNNTAATTDHILNNNQLTYSERCQLLIQSLNSIQMPQIERHIHNHRYSRTIDSAIMNCNYTG